MANSTWLSVQLKHNQISDYEVIFAQYQGALSHPEWLSLKIFSSHSQEEFTLILNQQISVTLQNAQNTWNFILKLFEVKKILVEELMQRNCFVLELRSPLYDLTRTQITPVLKNATLANLCQLVLTGQFTQARSLGLQPYRLALAQTEIDQALPVLKGLHESAYAFFTRILRNLGLSYYFDHTAQGELVISDHIAKFAVQIEPMQNQYASGELLTLPHYEQIQRGQRVSAETVITGGHPYLAPQILIKSATDAPSHLNWQISANEYDLRLAEQHSFWTLQAMQGQAHRNQYLGGGIVFPGQVDTIESTLLVQTAFTLEFDGHESGRIRAIPLSATGQPLAFRYRDAPDLAESTQFLPGTRISDVTGQTATSMSVGSLGHYHVILPEYVTDPEAARPMLDTRMIYPMHSEDHSQHFTLMNGAEGLLQYNAGTLGESLLVGTINSGGAGHLTQQDTAQNAYWQDASGNKTAFINQGAFSRTEATGRQTAYLMEAPNYHPTGASSYVRLGDPINHDAAYSTQAAEGGVLMASTGHYQEEHQGGLLHLSGNTGDDPTQPIPVQRMMTQLNPIATPNILQTSTANLHTEMQTSTTVTQTRQLTAGTFTEMMTAPVIFNTWSADNTHSILVNQNLQQSGTVNMMQFNTQNISLNAQTFNLTQTATLQTKQFGQKILTRNHRQNLEHYQTLQKSIKQSQEQINSQNLQIQNYTRTTQTSTLQTQSSNFNASAFNVNANTLQIQSLLMQGNATNAQSAALTQAWQAEQTQLAQQSADLKEEIIFYLDDPESLLPALQANVNQQPVQTIAPNSKTTYSLSNNDYKTGPIGLAWQADFGKLQNIVHPQIRNINVYNPSLDIQLPKPYFRACPQFG